jgi:hypothetical protein
VVEMGLGWDWDVQRSWDSRELVEETEMNDRRRKRIGVWRRGIPTD